MSRRFGRQQKKKLLKLVDVAEHAEQVWRSILVQEQQAHLESREVIARQRGKVAKAERVLELIARLNPDFPFLNNFRVFNGDRVRKIPTPYPYLVSSSSGPDTNQSFPIMEIDLYKLHADLEVYPFFHSCVMFRAELGPHKAGYNLSESAMLSLSVQDIAECLAGHLTEAIKANHFKTRDM